MEAIKAHLKIEEILVKESHLTQKPIEYDLELNYDIKPVGGHLDYKTKSIQINIAININDKNEQFSANVVMVGLFKYETDSLEDIMSYTYLNSPAIIFPYIRSYITALTSLSGAETITIPPMNMTALGEQLVGQIIEHNKPE